MKKINKKLIILILSMLILWSLGNAYSSFFQGYHNLDTSQNFIQLGYKLDINTDGQLISLQDSYINGLNQMRNGFLWACFDAILCVLLGYLIGNLKLESKK